MLSLYHVTIIKIIVIFYIFSTKSSKSGVDFTFTAHLNSDQTNFKGSGAYVASGCHSRWHSSQHNLRGDTTVVPECLIF